MTKTVFQSLAIALLLMASQAAQAASSVLVELSGDRPLSKSSFDLVVPTTEEAQSLEGADLRNKVRDMRFSSYVAEVERNPTTGFVSKQLKKAWHGDELSIVDETPDGHEGAKRARRFRVSGIHVELLYFRHERDPMTTMIIDSPQYERLPINFIAELAVGQAKSFDLPRPSTHGPARPAARRKITITNQGREALSTPEPQDNSWRPKESLGQ